MTSTTLAPPDTAIADPEWIAEQLVDPALRIVELDVSPTAYDGGHIPGAVLWNAYSDLRHPDYRPVEAAESRRCCRGPASSPAARSRSMAMRGFLASA